MSLGCKPQQCAMEVKETLKCIMCKTKCLKSHFTLVLSPSWDQTPPIFNLNRKRGETCHWHLEKLGQHFINNTNVLYKRSRFVSSYLNVAHTVLENKKFILQDKNMDRRKSCMSSDSFEIFVSGLPPYPRHKEGIWPIVPARTVM